MSVETAKKFLEEVGKDAKLSELLKDVSIEDLKQASEEMELDGVAGGSCFGHGNCYTHY